MARRLALADPTALDPRTTDAMGFIWTIIIGFVAGILAKLIHRGRNEPQGFVLVI